VPIHYCTRRAGRSKMTPAVQLRTAAEILSLPWVQREAIASLRAQTRAGARTAGAPAEAPRRETVLP